jgi:HK97 family phage major capsid protein
MRSFRVTTGEAEAKKVAIFGTVEDKLLRDVPSMERWVREDFIDEMKEAINDGLLNNDPGTDADAPLGLKTNAIQYTATPGYNNAFTANTTNYIDQIFAIIALMAYNKEDAGIVFVSSDVYYRIMHLKDTDGRYQNNNLVYTDNLGRLFIGGVEVVMADAEDIPGTNVLVIARDLGFKIYAYGPMVVERGLNGEDFRYDRTSFRGYQEFLSFIPENRENSVLYDTWANVKAAIEA